MGELVFYGAIGIGLVLAMGLVAIQMWREKPVALLDDDPLETRIARFWFWFGENAKALRIEGIGRHVAAISAHLSVIHRDLVWEIAPKAEDFAEWDFVISTDGRRELFPLVEQVVAAAPEVPGFRIVAFRQRGPDGLSIRTPQGEFSANDVWFEAIPSNGSLSLTLFVPDVALAGPAVILLDNTIGEYDAVMRVHELAPGLLPDDPRAAGLRRLPELREVVETLKADDH